MRKIYWLILPVLLFISQANAQEYEWVKKISASKEITSTKIAADKKSNLFVTANFQGTITLGDSVFNNGIDYGGDFFVAKFDAKGEVTWARHVSAKQAFVWNMTVDSQGDCYVIGTFSGQLTIGNAVMNGNEAGFMAKFDASGNYLWTKQFANPSFSSPGDVCTDNWGNVYLSIQEGAQSTIYKYDRYGNQSLFAQAGGEYPQGIAIDASGNVYLTGFFTFSNANFGNNKILRLSKGPYTSDSYVCKFDHNGKLLWVSQIIGSDMVESWNISVDRSGSSYITGRFRGQLVINKDTLQEQGSNTVFVAKYDAIGNAVWGLRVGNKGSGVAGEIFANISEDIYFSAHASGKVGDVDVPDNGNIVFAKTDKLGHIKWLVKPKGMFSGTSPTATDTKGHFYWADSFYDEAIFGKDTLESPLSYNLFIARLNDPDFTYPGSIYNISGHVYRDINSNCKQDAGEESLPNQLVKAEPGSYYALTDSNGNYTLQVEKGNYSISQVLPSDKPGLKIQQVCPVTRAYAVNLSGNGKDTTGFDFGNQVNQLSYLHVKVAADRRRRCFLGTTTVTYCNEGYAAASNVQVKVTYPQYVLPQSASTPWSSKQDPLLIFNIGTLAPGQCGTITLTDSVICGNESIRGLTQCVKAFITPKNNVITPDPRWDKSEVELKAVCKNNGFVRLTILNPGLGAMADSAAYRIYLDALQVFESKYKLQAKDSLSLEVPVNGKTIRLEADLRPYHPDGNRQPSVTLEGCGSAGTVSISKGFVNQLPQDDAPEEVAISCLPILDSYDPNDKQVSPAGVGEQHVITGKDELEYLVRFQNTGNDLAYNVIIQDTLDEHLDIATLEIGAASHPFTWNVSGQGRPVITWTFKDINLPDSISNEPKSHGYVRFRIGQKTANTLGTTITNQAAITFDFNSPVLTNLTVNTTGEIPQALRTVPVDVCQGNYPTQAQAGENIVLQTVGATILHANAAQKGRGQWKLISGKGTIAEPANPQSTVTGLGAGSTILEWTISLCDSISVSRVTVERIIPVPAITKSTVVVCTDETISLGATGTNLIWYADEQLTRKLAQGTNFQPTTGGNFYVTQTIDGYESKPVKVTATIQSRPAPPTVTAPTRLYCQGERIEPLQATGEGIRWYADSQLTQLLSTGVTYQPPITASAIFYVTQTVANCEGAASPGLVIIHPAKVSVQTKGDTLIAPLADAYQWYFEGKPLNKATAQRYIALNTGNYYVELKKESCTASSDPVYLSIHVPTSTLNFAPNPSPDRVLVELRANAMGRVEVRLLNTLGKVVQQVIWQKSTTILNQELDVSHLTRGVYFVEVSTGEGILVKKLVKN